MMLLETSSRFYQTPASRERKSIITRLQDGFASLLRQLPSDLVKETKAQAGLLLAGHVEGAVLQPPLEREDMDVSCPLVAADDDNMALLVEPKEQGEPVDVANRSERVGHGNKSSKRDDGKEEGHSSKDSDNTPFYVHQDRRKQFHIHASRSVLLSFDCLGEKYNLTRGHSLGYLLCLMGSLAIFLRSFAI